ncbi:2450_t:CDS:1 [Acaulospora morrowiae]|uniref:2450_t:CDS:1 n=1 Tax=Acaulospora morrowiae TaxID=94023 RepID=A0A9N8Z7I6_9GLOM|nr:2450_t:CDS:1 [Acaulospora morrowiae]
MNQDNRLDDFSSTIYSSTEPIHYSRIPRSQPRKVLPGTQYVTDEFLDKILDSVLTSEERTEFESKTFLSLYDLIFPNVRNNRNTKRYKNSFLIFRKDYQARKIAELGPHRGSRINDISTGAGAAWKKFSPEEKYMYMQLSLCAKSLHNKLWPNHNSAKKYVNYGYGELKGQYLTTFLKTPSNQLPYNNGFTHGDIFNEQSSNQIFLNLTTTHPENTDRLRTQPIVNALASYDRSLIDTINKHVRI